MLSYEGPVEQSTGPQKPFIEAVPSQPIAQIESQTGQEVQSGLAHFPEYLYPRI